MSATTVTYNGIVLNQVRITEYRIDNQSNAQTPSSSPLFHSITGEALVLGMSGESNSNSNAIANLREKLNTPRKPLLIRIVDPDGAVFDVVNSATMFANDLDEANGPFFKASVNQITGANVLVVNFTVEWSKSPSSLNRIKSFFCNATFSIDEVGLTTIRKTGSLQMISAPIYSAGNALIAPPPTDRFNSPNTATKNNLYPAGDSGRSDVVVDFVTSHQTGGDFPDYYRRFVSGNLYRGFRRMRQEYAVDESRTRLLFDIVDQEFVRGLPAPARVGDCSFTFERSLEDNSVIGIKHFIASVKGDRRVTIGELLTLCIRLSQNRIDYANDLIVKVRVSENNMLSENSVTFEVAAKGTSSQTFASGATETNPTASGSSSLLDTSLLLKNILSNININNGNGFSSFNFSPAPQPDAYGSALIVRVTPGAYDAQSVTTNASAELGYPTTFNLNDLSDPPINPEIPVLYSFPRGTFDAVEGQKTDAINIYLPPNIGLVPAGPNKGDIEKGKDLVKAKNKRPRLMSKGNTKQVVYNNIFSAPAVSFAGGVKNYQVCAPVVVQTDTSEGAKVDEPPNRVMGDRSVNGVITSMGYGVTSGHGDPNGHRAMVAAYDRTQTIHAPADLPATGPSPSDPRFIVQTGTNGVKIVAFYNNALPMPPDETQGAIQVPYTAGLGIKETLA